MPNLERIFIEILIEPGHPLRRFSKSGGFLKEDGYEEGNKYHIRRTTIA